MSWVVLYTGGYVNVLSCYHTQGKTLLNYLVRIRIIVSATFRKWFVNKHATVLHGFPHALSTFIWLPTSNKVFVSIFTMWPRYGLGCVSSNLFLSCVKISAVKSVIDRKYSEIFCILLMKIKFTCTFSFNKFSDNDTSGLFQNAVKRKTFDLNQVCHNLQFQFSNTQIPKLLGTGNDPLCLYPPLHLVVYQLKWT